MKTKKQGFNLIQLKKAENLRENWIYQNKSVPPNWIFRLIVQKKSLRLDLCDDDDSHKECNTKIIQSPFKATKMPYLQCNISLRQDSLISDVPLSESSLLKEDIVSALMFLPIISGLPFISCAVLPAKSLLTLYAVCKKKDHESIDNHPKFPRFLCLWPLPIIISAHQNVSASNIWP